MSIINYSKRKSKIKNKSLDNSSIPKYKPIFVFILLSFILYSNTLRNDYALDDAIVISKNVFTQKGISGIPEILKYDSFVGFWLNSYKDAKPEKIQEEKKLVAGGRYRPLSLISFAIEIQFFGKNIKDDKGNIIFKGNPFISHLINIILYLLTVILLYKILLKIIPKSLNNKHYLSIAFIASVLFLFHPIHTEVVANIKGRDEIMCLLGGLLSLWFTLKYIKTNKKIHLVYSSLTLFMGLLSKENAITFLAITPLTIYYFTNSSLKKSLIAFIPLLSASLIFLALRSYILGPVVDKPIVNEILNNPFLYASYSEKIASIFYTLFLYLKLLFFPHPLTYDYYPWHITIIQAYSLKAIISFTIYLLLGIYAIYGLIKKKDIISYSILIYLLALSVVSNLFFPIGSFMNERFIYISSIGFCTAIAYSLIYCIDKFVKNTRKANLLLSTILLCILSLYAFKTISRNKIWKNDLSLFTTDVKVSSNSAKSNCSAGGKLIEEAQRRINKNNKEIHDSLCIEAIRFLNRSIEIYPKYSDALILLGNAYYEYNFDISNSLECYTKALQLNTNNQLAYENAKLVLNSSISVFKDKLSTNSFDQVIESCKKILEIKPEMGEAYYVIGTLYGKFLNDIDNAILYLEKANHTNFNKSADFYKNIGVAYGVAMNYDKSKEYLLKSFELEPEDYQVLINLGLTYHYLGDNENADICFKKAKDLSNE